MTDGSSTYAVFIYLCGFIHENSTGAGIGYYINTTTFVEHPLSQTEMSPLIACENEASPWTNLIYPLASSMKIVGTYHYDVFGVGEICSFVTHLSTSEPKVTHSRAH